MLVRSISICQDSAERAIDSAGKKSRSRVVGCNVWWQMQEIDFQIKATHFVLLRKSDNPLLAGIWGLAKRFFSPLDMDEVADELFTRLDILSRKKMLKHFGEFHRNQYQFSRPEWIDFPSQAFLENSSWGQIDLGEEVFTFSSFTRLRSVYKHKK